MKWDCEMIEISVSSRSRIEFINITHEIGAAVRESNVKDGVCWVYVPHTTAGVTINEGADPSVVRDIQETLAKMVPEGRFYHHAEGNSPAHIKASLMGSSVAVLVEGGRLALGTWQAIFFCEFDGPRQRKVYIKTHGTQRT